MYVSKIFLRVIKQTDISAEHTAALNIKEIDTVKMLK